MLLEKKFPKLKGSHVPQKEKGEIKLLSACAVVGKHAGTGVVDFASFPCLVRHPKAGNHARLSGIIAFENLPVQKAFLCEWRRIVILQAKL